MQGLNNRLKKAYACQTAQSTPDAIRSLCAEIMELRTKLNGSIDCMDKKIKRIEKEMKGLEKADKKRDKVCAAGKKAMASKKKGKK